MPAEEFNLPKAWLQQLDADLKELEHDIGVLSKFGGERDEHRRFAESIREQQRGAERLLERLQVAADDDDDALREQVALRTAQVDQQRRLFRSALLQYRGNAAKTARQEREQLLSGATTAAELRRKKAQAAGNAEALNAAADVTTALQETVSMMNAEIDKSVGNIMAMQDSTDSLRRARGQYIAMDDLLKISKNLVRALERADRMDRWLMLAGLLLFSLVSFNILRKRIWIPGLHTLFRMLWYFVTMGFQSSSSVGELSVVVTEAVQVATMSVLATSTLTMEAPALETAMGSVLPDPDDTLSTETVPALEPEPAAPDAPGLDAPRPDAPRPDAPRPDAPRPEAKAEPETTTTTTTTSPKPVDSQPRPKPKRKPVGQRKPVYTLPVERPTHAEL
ncbi:Protein transport protein sec20 [Coemansia sp. RSA 552]|nr:Protein transport protein sec20 [Coemansia sp. RSA 552]